MIIKPAELKQSVKRQLLLESGSSVTPALVLFALWAVYLVATGYWSKGILFALVWLAIASYLIQSSRDVARQFFIDLQVLAKTESPVLETLTTAFLESLTSNKFLFFSVPLVAGIIALIEFSDIFPEGFATLLAYITLGLVFLFAGKGFWGVCAATLYLFRTTRVNLAIDPFFPDGKGGFTIPDDFLHRVGWYYFSGGLLLPMAFEFGRQATDDFARLLVALFLVVFFAVGIFAMIIGKFLIIMSYESARRDAMRASAQQMRKLHSEGGPKEAIENETKLQQSLEKMSRPQVDRYKFFGLIPQVVTAALPLASYGQDSLLKFTTDVFAILTKT